MNPFSHCIAISSMNIKFTVTAILGKSVQQRSLSSIYLGFYNTMIQNTSKGAGKRISTIQCALQSITNSSLPNGFFGARRHENRWNGMPITTSPGASLEKKTNKHKKPNISIYSLSSLGNCHGLGEVINDF